MRYSEPRKIRGLWVVEGGEGGEDGRRHVERKTVVCGTWQVAESGLHLHQRESLRGLPTAKPEVDVEGGGEPKGATTLVPVVVSFFCRHVSRVSPFRKN